MINSGDTAWVLISAALVLFMTPGLAIFYAGMVRAKSALNMMMMSFGALAIVFVLWIAFGFSNMGVSKEITDALPVALLRPFSSAGSRGFLIDSMNTFGADSLTGRLSSIFQCSAESTFYVIAVYFGSVNIKNTRYALSTMLLVDVICVITAILVATWFF